MTSVLAFCYVAISVSVL